MYLEWSARITLKCCIQLHYQNIFKRVKIMAKEDSDLLHGLNYDPGSPELKLFNYIYC